MKNLIVTLGLPPMAFVMLILAGMLMTHRWDWRGWHRGGRGWHRLGRGLCWTGLVALLLCGMPAVSGSLLASLESGYPTRPPPDHPPQAIVVLGGDVIRAADDPLGARPGLLTLDRLRTAAELHRRTGLPILVTGGSTQPRTAPVAEVMQQSLKEDFEAPAEWVEPKSSDTWENARFSAAILKPLGITSVYVVTHAWHMRRAMLAFRGTGLTVTAAPTAPDEALGPGWFDFVPRASGWQTGYYAAHEWIGYAYYALR
jgi:uncharacterized SAM-binding protein YcdF (DUF218 family)